MQTSAYAVFAEGSDVGKKVKGSKKKFVWEIIFREDVDKTPASAHTCVIELKHSVLAGRRTISFNGEVIHDSAKVLNGLFEHGWAHKKHLLRITVKADIVNLIAESHEYELWVDNVRYPNLPSYDEYVVDQEKKRDLRAPKARSGSNGGGGAGGTNYRAQLLKLVQTYDPKNVSKVDQVLAKWTGKEDQLIAGLKKKYAHAKPAGRHSPVPAPAPAAPADAWGAPAPATAADAWGSPAPAPAPQQQQRRTPPSANSNLFGAPAPTPQFSQQRQQQQQQPPQAGGDVAGDLFSPAPATQQQKAASFQDELSMLYAPAPAPVADPFAPSYGGGGGGGYGQQQQQQQQQQAYGGGGGGFGYGQQQNQPAHSGQAQTAPPQNTIWSENSNLFDLNNLNSR